MKVAITIFVVLHGILHLLGFAKAFDLVSSNQLTSNISKTNGIVWLLTAALFIVAGPMLFFNVDYWYIVTAIAIALSQYLILTAWHDAKYGTVANIVILATLLILVLKK